MKVYLASDHAGFECKEGLAAFLSERGFAVEDLGPKTFNPEDDYPDLMLPLALRIAQEKEAFGIILGLSGQGEAMAVNRVKGVRAAVYNGGSRDVFALSRMHNDANVLSMGTKFLTQGEINEAALGWLKTPFSGEERHLRRIAKLDNAG